MFGALLLLLLFLLLNNNCVHGFLSLSLIYSFDYSICVLFERNEGFLFLFFFVGVWFGFVSYFRFIEIELTRITSIYIHINILD